MLDSLSLYLLIFIGCGSGGILRYLVSLKVHSFLDKNFPFGTLVVNISGSFFIGILSSILLNKFNNSEQIRALLLTGLLGGYTTFSAFSIETVSLIKSGQIFLALLNTLLSVILSIVFAWIGITLGKFTI